MSIAHNELVTMAADLILSGETDRVWIRNQWWQTLPALVLRAMAGERNVATRQPEYTAGLVFVEPFSGQRRKKPRPEYYRWGDPTDTELVPLTNPPWRIAVCAHMPDDEKRVGIRYNPNRWTVLEVANAHT